MKNVTVIKQMAAAALALGALGVTTQASAADSADKGKLILNEYNAVGPSEQLEDCNIDEGDIFFGCVNGNGLNWAEFVVTGNNLNIRNWKVSWQNSDSGGHANNGSFKFKDIAFWGSLKAGTIVTVRDDGAMHVSNHPNTTYNPCSNEDWWIGVDALDTNYIVDAKTFSGSTPKPDGFKTDNDNWRVKIEDASGNLVLNWVGESISGLSGVGEDEVCKLEENPVFGIAAGDDYNDGDCSTYGGPNCHTGGGWVQSLDALCNAACSVSTGCCGGGSGDYSCYAANVEQTYY